MADMNASDSAISTDDLEIDSYDDVVKLLGADDAASMLADVAGNRFNREDIMRAILNGEDIHLDYWPDYEELEWATRVCGELLADTSLEWADGFIDAEKIETHEGLTVSDLSHAVECVLTDKFNDGLYEASLVDRTEIADTFAQEIKSRLDGGKLGHGPYVDSESLRDELGAEIVKTQKVRDFEGHVVPIDLVRLDSLRMGDALFRDHPVLVMPDTSLVFACLRVDGIAGCDLLRWCAVRMPNADSTITVTDDVRTLGLPRGRRMSRMELGGGCPFLPVTCRNGDRQARMYVKFDTGSAGYFHFSYADSGDAPPPLWFIDSLRWADGYASAIGWTNRNRVNSHFRGTIPRFEIQGTAIADMPVKRTFGHNRILGCKLFDWGQVVLDFRRKRFLFIPRGGEAKAPPQPACNFTLALSAGQLVVGQVWDEALADVIAPGDRILSLDGHPWDGDVCRFLLDPDPLDGTVCGIGTASGQHVVLTIETMK